MGVGEEGCVHSERRGEEGYVWSRILYASASSHKYENSKTVWGLTNPRPPHPRTPQQHDQTIPPHPLVDVLHYRPIESRLAEGGDDAEGDAEAEEGCSLWCVKSIYTVVHTMFN